MKINIEDVLSAESTEPPWIVKDILPAGSAVILAGSAGVGKSTLSYHLALCIAMGRPFLGQWETTPGKVLYLDEENSSHDLTKYVQRAFLGLTEVSEQERSALSV